MIEINREAKRLILKGEAPWLKDGTMSFNSIALRQDSPDTIAVELCHNGTALVAYSVSMPKFEKGDTLTIGNVNFIQKVEIV